MQMAIDDGCLLADEAQLFADEAQQFGKKIANVAAERRPGSSSQL
jgi:hypothetical protein